MTKGMRRPTMYDVAAQAGVSIATVSFAFTQPHRVRAATREAVLAAAESLGYLPSGTARGLARGRTGVIGFYSYEYVQETGSDLRHFPLYADEVQRGAQLECRSRGFALMLGAGRDGGDLPAVVDIAGRVDGLIAFDQTAPAEALARIARRIPVVRIGSDSPDDAVRAVLVDNRTGVTRLTEHLIRVHGARRLVYLGQYEVPEFAVRYAAFAGAVAAAGLPVPPPVYSHPGDEAGTIATLAGLPLPDAFVCATDQEALVVVDTLRAAGVAVPGPVAVTGFDGTLAGRTAEPRLTTVRQPMEEIGRSAVRLLAGMLDGSDVDPSPVVLPAPFVIGHSCGC